MSVTSLDHVGSAREASEAKHINVGSKGETKELYCLILKIVDGAATILLPSHSSYEFLNGNSVNNYTTVSITGSFDNSRTIVDPTLYWKYVVKIRAITDSTRSHRMEINEGEIVIHPALAGADWSIFDDSTAELKWGARSNLSTTVKELVQYYNEQVNLFQNELPDIQTSTPKAGTIEWKAYTYQTKVSQNLRDELTAFKNAAQTTARIDQKAKSQFDRFRKIQDGMDIDENEVHITDRNQQKLSSHAKVRMTSIYSNVEFRKASWGNIKARGRKFNTLMEKTPSTLIQPLTTFVKAIGDVEDIAISSLLAVYSIISLGKGFGSTSPTAKPTTTPTTTPNNKA